MFDWPLKNIQKCMGKNAWSHIDSFLGRWMATLFRQLQLLNQRYFSRGWMPVIGATLRNAMMVGQKKWSSLNWPMGVWRKSKSCRKYAITTLHVDNGLLGYHACRLIGLGCSVHVTLVGGPLLGFTILPETQNCVPGLLHSFSSNSYSLQCERRAKRHYARLLKQEVSSCYTRRAKRHCL